MTALTIGLFAISIFWAIAAIVVCSRMNDRRATDRETPDEIAHRVRRDTLREVLMESDEYHSDVSRAAIQSAIFTIGERDKRRAEACALSGEDHHV